VHAVSEECSEVGTAGGHDGAMHGEMPVLDAYDGVTQLSILAQVVQHVTRLQNNTPAPYVQYQSPGVSTVRCLVCTKRSGGTVSRGVQIDGDGNCEGVSLATRQPIGCVREYRKLPQQSPDQKRVSMHFDLAKRIQCVAVL